MNWLPIDELPPFQPRRFLPTTNWNVGDWSQVAPFFEGLEARIKQCATTAALEECLLDWSELAAALGEEWARRHVAMTSQTNDTQARELYLDFVEHVLPETQRRQFQLTKLFLSHPLRSTLPERTYEVNLRDAEASVALFRDENVALETEEAKLSQQYDETTASMTVPFRGDERTSQELWSYLQDSNRITRQEAWELSYKRALEKEDERELLFESMLRCRNQMAANVGSESYRDFAWQRLRRFDYTPAQCETFHSSIEMEILPVVCQLQKHRSTQLCVDTLRPWDTEADPSGQRRLRPFSGIPELVARMQRVFERIDSGFASDFATLQQLRLLDLGNRQNKVPGGYQVQFSESRMPFIFLNAVGVHMDVLMLFHEAGHAFHTMASRTQPLLSYRTSIPTEFCEVASMSMELIGSEHLSEFYTPEEVRRARRAHFEAILTSFPWMATLDAFQHWLYTHPAHSRAERTDAWLKLMGRFGGLVDWTGYERVRTILWHDVAHIFQSPFYFVEYGIGCLGALQVWSNWKEDRDGALATFKRALALGGSRPLPELFAAANCKLDFSVEAIRPLVRLVRAELEILS